MTFARAVVLISIAGAASSVGAQEVAPRTIATVKRAILPVTCGALDEKNQFRVVQIVGSGFLINQRGDFVTAAHVVEDLNELASQHRCFGSTYLTVEAPASDALVRTRWYRIKACRTNATLDLAVCFLTQNPFEDSELRGRLSALPFDSPFPYGDGTPIAFTGFPLEYARPVTSKGFIASLYPGEMIVDKNTWPGASGSPVYTAAGKVVGVVLKRGLGVAAGLAYARPSDAIMDFLTKENVEFTRS